MCIRDRLCIDICEQTSFEGILLDLVNPTTSDLTSDETLNEWLKRNTGTSHHISGTCKMGPNPTRWLWSTSMPTCAV